MSQREARKHMVKRTFMSMVFRIRAFNILVRVRLGKIQQVVITYMSLDYLNRLTATVKGATVIQGFAQGHPHEYE